MADTRQESLLRQLQSALGKPWPEGNVLTIDGGVPKWVAPSGGGSSLTWAPFTDIWTPDPGVLPHANLPPMYAYDDEFFYLTGWFLINWSAPFIDATNAPSYDLGDIDQLPADSPAGLPAPGHGSFMWETGTAELRDGTAYYVINLYRGGSGITITSGSISVTIPGAAIVDGATAEQIHINMAYPWVASKRAGE